MKELIPFKALNEIYNIKSFISHNKETFFWKT